MEYSVDFTLTDLGRDEAVASPLFEGIESVSPGTDPVLAFDFATGLLSATLHVDAADADAALELARSILSVALRRAGVPMTRLVGIEVTSAEVATPAA